MKIFKYAITLIASLFIQWYFLADFLVSENLVSSLITFLSIIFGFYVTSLAIFANSKYVSSLYQVTDEKDKTRTLLHTLIQNYKTGLIFALFSILYFLLVQFIFGQNNGERMVIAMKEWYMLPFIYIVFGNFWHGFAMMGFLVKIIIQEAKQK